MIAATTAKGMTIALFGLGGSGLASAHSLKAGGADLYCFDDNPERVEKAKAEGLNCVDLREVDFSSLDGLLLAPGVPLTHPVPHWTVQLANQYNVPVIGDVEIFSREHQAKAPKGAFIAITGTNGKSTTSALIAHIFKTAGRDVQLGGNIGTAVLSLDEPDCKKIYVIECSSYQIDLAPNLKPSVGILLNLAPDHLDRHGTMADYARVKKRLVERADFAIIGVDDQYAAAIAEALCKQGHCRYEISNSKKLQTGIYFDNGQLVKSDNGKSATLFDLSQARSLRGDHNGQNAAAAWAACSQIGLKDEEIAAGFITFPGLVHRMEQVGYKDRVLFVNDSKGTNADAAGHALDSFEQIYWIAGGLAKEGGIEDLRRYFPKIAKAYLIGEAAPEFAATLGADVPYEISETLGNAVFNAAADAAKDEHKEPVVLLSPACASFDQFANFEKRGDAFREEVLSLIGVKHFKGAANDK